MPAIITRQRLVPRQRPSIFRLPRASWRIFNRRTNERERMNGQAGSRRYLQFSRRRLPRAQNKPSTADLRGDETRHSRAGGGGGNGAGVGTLAIDAAGRARKIPYSERLLLFSLNTDAHALCAASPSSPARAMSASRENFCPEVRCVWGITLCVRARARSYAHVCIYRCG